MNIYKIAETLNDFELKIGVIKIPPIWGSKMSADDYYQHMRARVESGRRLLLPAEVGCSLAHQIAYKKIIEKNVSAVILEQDIALSATSLKEIEQIISTLKNPDFVHFAKYRHRFAMSPLENGIYIADTSNGFWGAAAYYLSPTMAKYVLSKHKCFIDLADNWQEFFVGCPHVPYYTPIFEHTGSESRIGPQRANSQNPSLIEVIKLRLLRWRMRYLSQPRLLRNIVRSRKKIS